MAREFLNNIDLDGGKIFESDAVYIDASSFNKYLSPEDDTIQKCLHKLDSIELTITTNIDCGQANSVFFVESLDGGTA